MTTVPSEDNAQDSADSADSAADIVSFLHHIQQQAQNKGENGENVPVAQGSFAIYPMEDGGVMVVARAEGGAMEGTHHHRISPRMIRALAAFSAPSGGRLKAIRAAIGGKP